MIYKLGKTFNEMTHGLVEHPTQNVKYIENTKQISVAITTKYRYCVNQLKQRLQNKYGIELKLSCEDGME